MKDLLVISVLIFIGIMTFLGGTLLTSTIKTEKPDQLTYLWVVSFCLSGLVVLWIAGLAGGRFSRSNPPVKPRSTEQRLERVERKIDHHRAEHAWEKLLRMFKESLGIESKKVEEKKKSPLGRIVFLLLIGVAIYFSIYPPQPPPPNPDQQPPVAFQIGDTVQVKDSQVKGYISFLDAKSKSGNFTKNLDKKRLFVNLLMEDLVMVCTLLGGKGDCFWIERKDLNKIFQN